MDYAVPARVGNRYNDITEIGITGSIFFGSWRYNENTDISHSKQLQSNSNISSSDHSDNILLTQNIYEPFVIYVGYCLSYIMHT